MSDTIIEVENISKRFIISHERKEQYSSFRDELVNQAKRIFSAHKKNQNLISKEEFWALKDISFEVKQGDRIGLIGRNGAGKSTLLKVLSRITEPTGGRIQLNGRVASLLEVGTGFHPELTGKENIFLNGAILGMSRSEIRARFDEIVAFAEVEQFLDTPVKRYSSGMYVRLAFAVAAHLEPEILIVDEVLAVGDSQFQKKCLGKMEDVSKGQGRTVIFVSHNMGVISQLCNKTIVMNKGQINFFGSTPLALTNYNNIERNLRLDYENEQAKEYEVTNVKILNESKATTFKFSDEINISVEINLPSNLSGLHIGVSVNDKWKRKLFTSITKVEKKGFSGCQTFYLCIPSNLLLSGEYSLDVATFIPNGISYIYLSDICPFRMEDYSSNMSVFGDADIGTIHVNCRWG